MSLVLASGFGMMQGFSDHDSKDGKTAFWKKNNRSVPGRASPKKEVQHHHRTASSSSFEDFQDSVNDAWDMGDDEFCVMSDVRISARVAHSTALSVINNHRTVTSSPSADPPVCKVELSEGGKMEAMQRLASQREMPPPPPLHAPTSSVGVTDGSSVVSRPVQHLPGHQQSLPKAHIPKPTNPVRLRQTSVPATDRESAKLDKFMALIDGPSTNLVELRSLCWSGTPPPARANTWRLLSGYLPANVERRQAILKKKREEYWNFVQQYYCTRHEDIHEDTYRQIHIDIPRMSPLIPLFQQPLVQEAFERILYIWAIRHPASGYVQGMNDLVTPYYVVFLQEAIPPDSDLDNFPVANLPEEMRKAIEADSFWLMSRLLDGIQDNYTFAQPGIQTKVNQLKDLVRRINDRLHAHLERHHIDYLQFSFRWMNNLLMRELPLRCTIRLWDTYHAETNGFANFHLYVCAAFLNRWSKQLLTEKDFQGLMLTLQNLPTLHWTNEEISLLVAEAFKLKYMFADAPNHLQTTLPKP